MPPMDFDLRQLQIFCKVFELSSFSKAAEAVCLAQASVSERIANLESSIGAKLFDRLGRQITPTRAGTLLYEQAQQLLALKRRVDLVLEDFLGVRRGAIQIGGSTIPGEYILPRSIQRFCLEYRDIAVHLHIAPSAEIEKRVLAGDLELGVVGSRSRAPQLHYHAWLEDELVLALPADHALAARGPVTWKDLEHEPLILREPGSATLKILEAYLHQTGHADWENFRIVARFTTSTAVKEAIKAGLGISILSRRALETEIQAGTMKTVPLEGPPLTRSFFLITDRRRTPSPLAQAMLGFLTQEAQHAPTLARP